MSAFSKKTTGIITYSDYRKAGTKVLYAFMLLIMILTAIVMVLPPIWLFLSGFKSASELTATPYRFFPEHFNLGKIVEVWKMIDFGRYFLNTIIVVLGAVVCSVIFNGLFAYGLAIVKPKGYKIAFILILGSYMIPSVTGIVPLFDNIVKLKLINSYVPLWLVFGANAFYLIMFKTYFESMPATLFEAAKLDGSNKLNTFFKIVIPLAMPIVGVIAIFSMSAAWNDFLLPYLVLQDSNMDTIMVKIYKLQSTMGTVMGFGPDKLLMVLTISIIPQIILFAIFQRKITDNAVVSGMKD